MATIMPFPTPRTSGAADTSSPEVELLLRRADELMMDERPHEALVIYRAVDAREDITVAEKGAALFGLGTCHLIDGNLAAACVALKTSWEALFSAFGLENATTARAMVMYSQVLFARGDFVTGMDVGREALASLEKIYGLAHEQTATAAFFLAGGARSASRMAEAEDLVGKAMKGWSALHGQESLQVAMCLDALGTLHDMCGEEREGTDWHAKAWDIKLRLLGPCAEVAVACGALGLSEARCGNWRAALDRLDSAIAMMDALGDPSLSADRTRFVNGRDACLTHIEGGTRE